MKQHKAGLAHISVIMLCLLALVALCGCETVKGMGRDIKSADEWFREHAW